MKNLNISYFKKWGKFCVMTFFASAIPVLIILKWFLLYHMYCPCHMKWFLMACGYLAVEFGIYVKYGKNIERWLYG